MSQRPYRPLRLVPTIFRNELLIESREQKCCNSNIALKPKMIFRSLFGFSRHFFAAAFLAVLLFSNAPQSSAQQLPSPDENVTLTHSDKAPDTLEAPSGYGMVRGRIVDQNGKPIAAADVKVMHDPGTLIQQRQSDEDGEFAFDQVPAGDLQLVISEDGFSMQTISCTLRPGENSFIPQITLSLSTVVTEIRVLPPTEEIAKAQIADEEKQRILGIVPNFYVTYLGQAAPLDSKQKFQLALRATTDPVTFAGVGLIAGMDQASGRFSGYGQGAQGYAKRYGASYANFNLGLLIGGAVLPSVLKQDPRYFYKGTGSKRSRFLYAISRTFICKGDNQLWQPNYSSVLGDLGAAGISNLYLPEKDRHGASLTVENAAIHLGTTAAINVLQEFVLHRVTWHKTN
jgi:Carboxypeptidase regulatory-like domain